MSTVTIINTPVNASARKYLYTVRWGKRLQIKSYQFLALLKAIVRSGCNITRIDTEGDWTLDRYPDNIEWKDDSHIPGSIKYTFPDFKMARYLKEYKPYLVPSSFELSPEDLSVVRHIFNKLTHLDLQLASTLDDRFVDPSDEVHEPYWSQLPELLRSLTSITHLSLDLRVTRNVRPGHKSIHCRDDIADLFQNPPVMFPRLTSLRLCHFQSCGLSLLSLIQRHMQLRDLTLRNVIEISVRGYSVDPFVPREAAPAWIGLIETLRAYRLRRLDLSCLEGLGASYNFYLAGSENTNLKLARVYDYVLHGYRPNPLGPDQEDVELWDDELL